MSRITKRFVDSLEPGDREVIRWDDQVPGFGIRVTRNGVKTYILKYRAGHGRSAPIRKPTIGRHGAVTADEARRIAKEWKARIALGGDPSRARAEKAKAPTMRQLCDDYLASHAQLKRSGSHDRRMIERDIRPALGSRQVSDISRRDIEAFRDSQRAAPIAANRKLALLSKMFNLAIGWGWITQNPVDGVQRNAENKRERYLIPEEIAKFNLAAELYIEQSVQKDVSQRTIVLIRLLALTGARRGEVLKARWENFDLERGVWTKPSAHTKQNRIHRVPLSSIAIDLLRSIQLKGEHRSGYIFPSKFGSKGHITDIKKPWQKLLVLAGLEGVRLHDLRHTYASILAGEGISLPQIGALLGHTQVTTTHRYAHLLDDPLRAATGKVGAAYR